MKMVQKSESATVPSNRNFIGVIICLLLAGFLPVMVRFFLARTDVSRMGNLQLYSSCSVRKRASEKPMVCVDYAKHRKDDTMGMETSIKTLAEDNGSGNISKGMTFNSSDCLLEMILLWQSCRALVADSLSVLLVTLGIIAMCRTCRHHFGKVVMLLPSALVAFEFAIRWISGIPTLANRNIGILSALTAIYDLFEMIRAGYFVGQGTIIGTPLPVEIVVMGIVTTIVWWSGWSLICLCIFKGKVK